MQHLAIAAVQRSAGLDMEGFPVLLKGPAARLGGLAAQRQTLVACRIQQVARVLWRTVTLQVARRGHTQAAVVGQPRDHQRGVGQIAHAHGAVIAFGRQVHHAITQIERDADFRVQVVEAQHQRRHMAAAKAGRCRDAQLAAGAHAAGADGGFHVGDIGQDALAFFQKGAAFGREADAARGAHQQLDAQVRFQRVHAATDHGRGHAFSLGGGRQAASLGDGDKGFDMLELVHPGGSWLLMLPVRQDSRGGGRHLQ